ncbi:MAG: CoA ester lyase [Burkholderiales bacterium]
MRSLLFVPGHDERKQEKALGAGADALILDLEDSVPESLKTRARDVTAAFVRAHGAQRLLFVRVNALSTPFAHDDIAAAADMRCFGIMLPKCESARDVSIVDRRLSELEARRQGGGEPLRILPIVTETAASMFGLGTYASDRCARLFGMLWGAEDLAADVGATANRQAGDYTAPFALARNLCLFAASAARVLAVDAVYTDIRNAAGLRDEASAAAMAGFGAKAAIHPAQVPIINDAFTPSPEAVERAVAVLEAFTRRPDAGAVSIDGRMYDRPHLTAALRVIERSKDARTEGR